MAGLLEGKVALITGAANGIGRATALAAAREGAKVLVVDAVPAGEDTARAIKQAGGEAAFHKCDVTRAGRGRGHGRGRDQNRSGAWIAHTTTPASSARRCAPPTTPRRISIAIIAVDLKGVWLCMKYEILQMLKQGARGAIVNTASAAGLVGSHGQPAYTAAKHGVVGLTKVAALEYARHDIRVNAVCPGVIDTAMVAEMVTGHPRLRDRLIAVEPIRRMGKPEEIGEAVVWLMSDHASFVTGASLPVDGAMTAQ